MLRCLEHLIPAIALLSGQFIAFHVVPWANTKFELLPRDSLWLPVLMIAVGFVLCFVILMGAIGSILLDGKLGLINLEDYNKKYPGFR
jgi:hypothetical protein